MIEACASSPSYIRSIAPYQPGKPISDLAREMGMREADIVKLASNENPLGCSAVARDAIAAQLAELARYPDGNCFDLKQALCAFYRVRPEQVVLGSGSNDVLELVARAFLSPGTSSVYAQHAFVVYPLATQATGASGIEVPARGFGHDLEAMAAAVRADTRVLWIANPNNPTGTVATPDQVRMLLRRVPPRVIVVLDEAYWEYLPEALRAATLHWVDEHPNLVVTRTFSKAYGLAGLRIGFGVMHPEVADLLNRVRLPFNVNNLAQAAAQAALADQAFVARSRALNDSGMRQLVEGFNQLGLDYIPSVGNFVSVRVGAAPAVYQRLLKQGVIVRPLGAYGMPEHLRASIGTESENAKFIGALRNALHA